ncbi:MAG: pyruvate carboxyltransferase [Pelosinus sp.]|nr:pyruvate carboxyltransferase [Pelosinus sp.]
MCTSISWVDYTLNEAIKKAVSWSQLAMIVRYLAQIGVYTGDVWLNDWNYYLEHNSSDQDTTLLSYIKNGWRIKIFAGRGETEAAIASGFSSIILSWQYSPWQSEKMLERELKALSGKKIYLSFLDAGEYTKDDWRRLWPLLQKYHVKGLLYSDGRSSMDALGTYNKLTEIQKSAVLPIEFHGHNAYGLATANALSALRAGISRITGSVGGIGSHTPLEEIWMVSKYFLGCKVLPNHFADYCRKILICLGVMIPGNKAIIGSEIFSHESGIHVDGITKNPQLYEAFSPQEVGLTRKLVIGKHSGSAALRYKLQEWKLGLSTEQSKRLLKEVREMATVQKTAISDYQLKKLYFKTVSEV